MTAAPGNWRNWINVFWEDMLSRYEALVAGLIEADNIAVGRGEVIAHKPLCKVSIDDGDLLQAV
ncbi:MAG: hypothetical protein JWO08_4670 [Verrucomicrobiaceae bacterium]|nr:hypothetical protein [Verrucomicrobiaceae bacterium]